MWSRRAQEYEAKINSGDLIAISEVVRDLYRSDDQPEQSYSERQLFEQAMDRMSREIGAVNKLTLTEAVQLIEKNLAKSPKRSKYRPVGRRGSCCLSICQSQNYKRPGAIPAFLFLASTCLLQRHDLVLLARHDRIAGEQVVDDVEQFRAAAEACPSGGPANRRCRRPGGDDADRHLADLLTDHWRRYAGSS